MKFLHSRLSSFKHAWKGLVHVIKTQRNAWIHLTATLVVIVVAVWLKLTLERWMALILVIGLVWIAEFLNTALEVVVDIASPELHPLARVGKDVGAAAVLLAAVLSVIVGLMIFIPAIITRVGK